jgi:hypothetical protein
MQGKKDNFNAFSKSSNIINKSNDFYTGFFYFVNQMVNIQYIYKIYRNQSKKNTR